MTPPRPLHNSPIIRSSVVSALLDDTLYWAKEEAGQDLTEQQTAQIISQLAWALAMAGVDGYDLAKYLDGNHNWKPDAQLVKILDGAAFQRDLAYDDLVRAWVAENQIKPELKIGDHVDITLKDPRGTYCGIIVALKTDIAQYAVSVPDLGQTFDQAIGGQYYSVDYEVLEAEQDSSLDQTPRLDPDAAPEDEEGVYF